MAEARTTLLSSVFISATVCRTVASKVASSTASTPWLACPRATRPSRLNISFRNAMDFSSLLRFQVAQQMPRRHYIHQQEMHARQDIVFIVWPQVLQLAKVVQRDRNFAVRHFVKLKIGSGDAVIGRQHTPHRVRRNGRFRRHRARQREKEDVDRK